jgi:hypothetical protein
VTHRRSHIGTSAAQNDKVTSPKKHPAPTHVSITLRRSMSQRMGSFHMESNSASTGCPSTGCPLFTAYVHGGHRRLMKRNLGLIELELRGLQLHKSTKAQRTPPRSASQAGQGSCKLAAGRGANITDIWFIYEKRAAWSCLHLWSTGFSATAKRLPEI